MRQPESMRQRSPRWTLALMCLVLLPGCLAPALAQTPPSEPTSPPDWSAVTTELPPWLDEVRSQRQAWEARRQAAREAYELRRRLTRPRSAAHQEAWEQDITLRRAERAERIQRERELFHQLPPGPLLAPLTEPAPPAATPGQEPAGTTPGAGFDPPGWDNLWYFRGY